MSDPIVSKLPAGTVVVFEGRAGKLLAAAHLEFEPIVEAQPAPEVEAPPVVSERKADSRQKSSRSR